MEKMVVEKVVQFGFGVIEVLGLAGRAKMKKRTQSSSGEFFLDFANMICHKLSMQGKLEVSLKLVQ